MNFDAPLFVVKFRESVRSRAGRPVLPCKHAAKNLPGVLFSVGFDLASNREERKKCHLEDFVDLLKRYCYLPSLIGSLCSRYIDLLSLDSIIERFS